MRCPICGSSRTRPKVQDGREWWFICDNWDEPHIILHGGKEYHLRDEAEEREIDGEVLARMFYFTEDGRMEVPGIKHVLRVSHHELASN
jgi:hypothetical protein